jgi:glycosyltransferase involved in cell wall biosynthesis
VEQPRARTQKIAIVASLASSLTNFRLQLIKAMVDKGHEVTAFAPDDDEQVVKALSAIGVNYIKIPMARTGVNPFVDLRTLWALWRHFRRMRPDVVIPYTMKPIIYGCLAARLAGVPRRFALFTGMGHIFSADAKSNRARLVRGISVWLYRRSLVGVESVFVYNDADSEDISRYRLIPSGTLMQPVPGSGIDLKYFPYVDPPKDKIRFLLVARLLREKGVFDYAMAARHLLRKYKNVEFALLGPLDPHPASIKKAEIASLVEEGVIEYLGETRDVRPFLAACSVFVLPTYYREGIPRSILEAMATGRAIITTDSSGCRETVDIGRNGYLVPTRDHVSLAKAMENFIVEPQLVATMGRQSNVIARERFDVHAVNHLIVSTMKL